MLVAHLTIHYLTIIRSMRLFEKHNIILNNQPSYKDVCYKFHSVFIDKQTLAKG